MKKSLVCLALVCILCCGLSASARPNGPHHHGGNRMHPASLNHVTRPHMMHHHARPHITPIHRHRIGCPIYRGYGHRCTCHRHYYGGSGVYIDFRLPIFF